IPRQRKCQPSCGNATRRKEHQKDAGGSKPHISPRPPGIHRRRAIRRRFGLRGLGGAPRKRGERRQIMSQIKLYPLLFEPIYQYRLWGGRRLANWLAAPLPADEPIGEAWILSDRADHASSVRDGPLRGQTITQLMQQSPVQMLGKLAGYFSRFPLLLKFLDVRKKLSVQVHPPDAYAALIPAGETGKTEAWVVLEKGLDARIYAGLKPATTAKVLRAALA